MTKKRPAAQRRIKPKSRAKRSALGSRNQSVKPVRAKPRTKDDLAADLLATIARSSDAAIINETVNGIVTGWNESAERIFGYSVEEMIGQSIGILGSPSRPREMGDILARVRQGERIERYETERRRKDGNIAQVLVSMSPVLDTRGRVVGITKVVHDIGALKSTEARLEEMTHALNLAPAMVRDMDGRILLWGTGLEALYGLTAAEAIGRVSHELLRTEFLTPLKDIQAELLHNEEWQGELVHRHRDGRRMTVTSRWALHRDAQGVPVSVLEVDLDVTEERRAQSLLEEREAGLRSILESAPEPIITIDERGLIQSFSGAAEKLFGYVAGEVVGQNVKLLMPQPFHDEHDGYVARYVHTGEKRIIGIGRQVEGRRKDGTIFPMDLAVGEARTGKTRIFTGFVRDLSARVRMEEDLRQAQKMEAVGQLTGGVAHDFNNILTVISGDLEMLERRMERPEDREILNEAQEATELGAQLASRLLAFGRRQPINPKPTDLSALARNMADLLRRTLGEAVELETNLAPHLPIAMVDVGQAENALLNVAINARDAMPSGGKLVIETRHATLDRDYAAEYPDVVPGDYVMLAVSDTGTGMTPEVRQRAFEPFFSTKAPGAGTGLGLSMVYGFVKQSAGHIALYSEVGHGTTIRIYLPAFGEKTQATEASAARPTAPRAQGETVLVVEDDPRVRRVSIRRLKELGYRVIEAENGPAALEIVERREPFDLLFTDVVMAGGMTGIELANAVRRRLPGIKVLFTSGYAEPAIMREGLATENASWLAKPYTIDDLQAKLRALLDA